MKKITVTMIAAVLFFVSAAWVSAGIQTVITPGDNVGTEFGRDVAIIGQTILVGESSGGTGYIYELENCAWVQKAALSTNKNTYGHPVALSDNFAIVGSGDSVYVFEKPDTGWTDTNEGTVLIPDDFNAEEYYISDVNISENILVIGTGVLNLDNQRQFHIFEYNGIEWLQTATISENGLSNPNFGWRVDVYGNRIMVSGKINNSGKNTLYIYKKDEDNRWYREAELTDELDNSLLSLSITDSYAIVGGIGNSSDAKISACIFKYIGDKWIFSQKFSEFDEMGNSGQFGRSVDITPEYAVIGATTYSAKGSPACGSAYILKNEDGTFVKTERYIPKNPQLIGFFGYSVSISDDYFVAGHIGDHLNGRNGSASVISLFTPGDLDGDDCVGKNDAAILRTWLNHPVSECPECDLDGDCKITVLDARKLVTSCTNTNCECP